MNYTYSPYGASTASVAGVVNPFGFADSYTDPDSGLIYLMNRWYDPSSGQFLSVDPLVQQTGAAYSYTGDDPVNAVDPTGLSVISNIVAAAGIVLLDGVEEVATDGAASAFIPEEDAALLGEEEAADGASEEGANAAEESAQARQGGCGETGGAESATTPPQVVIGGMEDIGPESIGPGEETLASRLPDNTGDRLGNWLNNREVLQQAMDEGNPIRDASVDSEGNLLLEDTRRFITMERDYLRSAGWTYDPSTTLWMPPGS